MRSAAIARYTRPAEAPLAKGGIQNTFARIVSRKENASVSNAHPVTRLRHRSRQPGEAGWVRRHGGGHDGPGVTRLGPVSHELGAAANSTGGVLAPGCLQVALGALAFNWARILFRCWRDTTIYDESRYLKHLKTRPSPLILAEQEDAGLLDGPPDPKKSIDQGQVVLSSRREAAFALLGAVSGASALQVARYLRTQTKLSSLRAYRRRRPLPPALRL